MKSSRNKIFTLLAICCVSFTAIYYFYPFLISVFIFDIKSTPYLYVKPDKIVEVGNLNPNNTQLDLGLFQLSLKKDEVESVIFQSQAFLNINLNNYSLVIQPWEKHIDAPELWFDSYCDLLNATPENLGIFHKRSQNIEIMRLLVLKSIIFNADSIKILKTNSIQLIGYNYLDSSDRQKYIIEVFDKISFTSQRLIISSENDLEAVVDNILSSLSTSEVEHSFVDQMNKIVHEFNTE